jgi:mannonate dehydratase
MEQTWRWYGPNDGVTLSDARQAGATGIVNALHHLQPGEVWTREEIEQRKAMIEAAGLTWSVVESVNISEDIKKRTGNYLKHIDAYKDSIRNLAACGIYTICYNFMPVVDWTRTDLDCRMPDGALAMSFDATAFAAFDLYMLKRKGAETDWPEERQRKAHTYFQNMSESERDKLTRMVLAGLPGTDDVFSMEEIRKALATYDNIGPDQLRANLGEFLRAVCPVAEEVGVRLCIHPDDPPRSLFGLPRICSTESDLAFILEQTPEKANGITFCTGSLGVRPDNNLVEMARRFGPRIYFAHLRTTKREADDPLSFHEAPHLAGDVDIIGVMKELVLEERRRRQEGRTDEVPVRSDHGQRILTDIGRKSAPGYPAVGRLKGLAELRGCLKTWERVLAQ